MGNAAANTAKRQANRFTRLFKVLMILSANLFASFSKSKGVAMSIPGRFQNTLLLTCRLPGFFRLAFIAFPRIFLRLFLCGRRGIGIHKHRSMVMRRMMRLTFGMIPPHIRDNKPIRTEVSVELVVGMVVKDSSGV